MADEMKTADLDTLDEDRSSASRWPMILVVALIILILGFIAWDQRPWAASDSGPATSGELGMLTSDTPQPGSPAPDFALLNEQGERFMLSEFEGRPVFLNFWATWCSFCLEEMPDMQRVQEQYGDDLVVIGVNAGDSVEDGEDFVRSVGISYLRLYDRDLEVTDGYRVQAMPTSYFIAPDGTIADFNFGFMVYDQMVEKVERAVTG
ncbi:redoxin domain-containing protein [soil metagenome]